MGKLTLFGDVLVPELRDGFLVAIISRHHPAPVGHKHQIITKSVYIFYLQILIIKKKYRNLPTINNLYLSVLLTFFIARIPFLSHKNNNYYEKTTFAPNRCQYFVKH